jgi:hypothetical protein
MLQITFLVSLESSRGGGVHWPWFHGVWTCCAKSSWILNDFFTENFGGIGMGLWCWAGFNGIFLVRFGFRMWEILIFKWFLLLKTQINSKKTRFWKEKSVEDVVTLGPTAQATLVSCLCRRLSWKPPFLWGFWNSQFYSLILNFFFKESEQVILWLWNIWKINTNNSLKI